MDSLVENRPPPPGSGGEDATSHGFSEKTDVKSKSYDQNNTLQQKRRRSRDNKSFGDSNDLLPLAGDQEEFWASLQFQYNGQMTTKTKDQQMEQQELEWDYEDIATPSVSNWTFNDFMEQYNQLYAALNQIQEIVFSSATSISPSRVLLHEALAQHLEGIREQYEHFMNRSSLMATEFTDLREEVMCRVELLAAKWEILMARAVSAATRQAVDKSNPDNFHSDIEQDVRGLRKWLREMEGKILPLQFKAKWSQEAIDEKMREIQVILSDIESHGQVVKSVLRLCEDLQTRGDGSPRQSPHYDVDRALRVAKGLEDRWHCVWLRSLEWQCFLEQLAWNQFEDGDGKDGQKKLSRTCTRVSLLHLATANYGCDSEDEPRCKVPKLLDNITASPVSTLLRTKRRKTSELARWKDNKLQQQDEGTPTNTGEKDKNAKKSLLTSWNKLLEAAAASISESERKTLKVTRKSKMNNNGVIVVEDNRHRSESPNNNTPQTSSSNDNEVQKRLIKENPELNEVCKMATSESEQSLSSGISSPATPTVRKGSAIMVNSRQCLPNCATYFFQHVSEDDENSMKKSISTSTSPPIFRKKGGVFKLKKSPYDEVYEDLLSDDYDHLLLSDESFTDFLGSDTILKELQDDDDHGGAKNVMESSTNTVTNEPFLNEDIQELVQRAEELVREDDVNQRRGSRHHHHRLRPLRQRRRSRLVPLDGCEASGEATSASEEDEVEDSSLDDDFLGSEMDTSISSHDQTLTASCSTTALDVVTVNTSALTLGSASKLKKSRRRSLLSASESHLPCVKYLNHQLKARSSTAISNGKILNPFTFRKRQQQQRSVIGIKKFAVPCISISSDENEEEFKFQNGGGDDEINNRVDDVDDHEADDENTDSAISKKPLLIGPITESPRSIESEEDFWDQEKYLSEHNYDEAIDEDTALRILNFGDDYRNFIDSMSDGLSNASGYHPPRHHRRKFRRNPQFRDDFKDSMSESEVEDVRRLLNESKNQFEQTEAKLSQYLQSQPEVILLTDYISLKKTCEENMSCLAILMEPILKESDSATLKKTGRELKGLLHKWDGLLRSIIRRIGLTEILQDIQKDIDRLEQGLADVLAATNQYKRIQSSNELREQISSYKAVIVTLTGYKSDLFSINLGVHNFLAELACSNGISITIPSVSASTTLTDINNIDEDKVKHQVDVNSSLTAGLKEKVVELYARWDDAFHMISGCLAESETALAKLTELEAEATRLVQSIVEIKPQIERKQASGLKNKLVNDEEDNDSGISGESSSCSTDSEIAQRERLLERLRILARELEQSLSPESKVLREISQNLDETTNELKNLRRFTSNNNPNNQDETTASTSTSVPATSVSSSTNTPFERDEKFRGSSCRRGCSSGNRRRSWRSRVVRTAIPMQIGLFLMWLFTWLLEPTCCDSSNTFLLTPQLRYVNGPPPI